MTGLPRDEPCEALEYDVVLVKRGDELSRGQESRLSSISYSRVLDGISDATVEIETPCESACGELALADHWNTDLLITHGPQRELVWAGPVRKVRYRTDRVIVEAQDMLAWATKRVLTQDHNLVDEDVTRIAEALWLDAVSSADRPDHELLVYRSGVVESREVKASQHRRLWNVLQEMLDAGLDVTTFGRRVLFGLPSFQPLVLDDTMVTGDVEVVKDGDDMATRVIADASADVVGIAPDGPRRGANGYPLLEEVLFDGGLQDQSSADNAARARLDFSEMGIRRVRAQGGLTLNPSVNLDPKKMIAGQLVNFTALGMCYSATETLRLGRIEVTVSEGREIATVDLQPLGASGFEGTV